MKASIVAPVNDDIDGAHYTRPSQTPFGYKDDIDAARWVELHGFTAIIGPTWAKLLIG